MKEKKKKILIYSIAILLLIALVVGLTYAIYSFTGTGDANTITTGQVSMSYTEKSNVINIQDALPIQDEEGYKEGSEYFDFSVTSNMTLNNGDPDSYVNYEIILEPLSVDSGYQALNENQVKVYLTTLDNGDETVKVESLINNLSDSGLNKILYSTRHTHTYGTNTITTNYRLRAYIPYNVDASNWNNTDNKYQYKFRVNVNGDIDSLITETPEYCFQYTNDGTNATITGYLCYSGNTNGYETITDVVIPSKLGGYPVTEIGNIAFYQKGLTSLVLSNLIVKIGNNAFAYNQLTSLTIPDSVTSIGNLAFVFCPNLTSIVVGSNNPVYDSRNNSNAIIETSTNKLILGCKNTIIPDSVTTIGNYAFEGMDLTSVIIPNSVTSIGDQAFTFNQLTSIVIPDSVTAIGRAAFAQNNLSWVYIGNNSNLIEETGIGNFAFATSNYISLGYVNNPDLITIYNNSGKSFKWYYAINDSDSVTSFVTGTVPSYIDGSEIYNSVTITTGDPR